MSRVALALESYIPVPFFLLHLPTYHRAIIRFNHFFCCTCLFGSFVYACCTCSILQTEILIYSLYSMCYAHCFDV